MCTQRRHRSTCASAQSDQNLRCAPEETFGAWLSKDWPVKTLIRLRGCAGWYVSSLGTCVWRMVQICFFQLKEIQAEEKENGPESSDDVEKLLLAVDHPKEKLTTQAAIQDTGNAENMKSKKFAESMTLRDVQTLRVRYFFFFFFFFFSLYSGKLYCREINIQPRKLSHNKHMYFGCVNCACVF